MLNLDELSIDRFKVTIDGSMIEINHPKLKTLNKIFKLSKVKPDESEEDVSSEMLLLILNNNKSKKKFDLEFVEEYFDTYSTEIFMEEFRKWIQKIKTNPN